jgi:imidazole glycerol-phosphate synthase subunit HisF
MKLRPRVIPCLLLRGRGLVKGVRFKDHRYLGDPINAVHIFNTKEVDELAFLDISATAENRIVDLKHIEQIADECYMPFAVGGGIRTVEQTREILNSGAEKVIINTAPVDTPNFIRDAAEKCGSQSIVASIDARKNKFGQYDAHIRCGVKSTGLDPVKLAVQMEFLGAGEILLTSIDREGTMEGYDLELIKRVSKAVTIPVIASGGAGKKQDLADAINIGNASAVAAGSMFVFHGPRRAVLINYPDKKEMEETFK